MKKLFLSFLVFFLAAWSIAAQQNLTLDPSLNGGRPHVDTEWNQYYTYAFPMRFKQLNDSTYAYFANMKDYGSGSTKIYNVYIKTLKNNGTIDKSKSFEVGSIYDINQISDVVIGANQSIYVLIDAIGMFTVGPSTFSADITLVQKFMLNAANEYEIDTLYGNYGTFSSSSFFKNAKGYISTNNEMVFFCASGSSSPDLARYVVTPDGQNSQFSIIYNNGTDTSSVIGDMLMLSDSTIIIADNAFVYSSSSMSFQHLNRLLKFDTQGNLVTGFGTNGIKLMDNWYNFSNSSPSRVIFIEKLYQDGNQILVTGHSGDPTPTGWGGYTYSPRAIISRLNQDGSNDNGFSSGVYQPSNGDFGYDFFHFRAIRKTSDNKYLVFGGGRRSGQTSENAFILAFNSSNGALQTTYGNGGKMFENFEFRNIHDARIIQPIGGTAADAQILILGSTDSSDIFTPFGMAATSAMARLIWSTTTSVLETADNIINVYPNPAQNQINVELKEEEAILLFDLQGRLLLKSPMAQMHQINISTLPSGLYLLRSSSGQLFKFVKS